jgi:oligoribonuclease
MNTDRIAWLDLETTGLNEVRGEILECGVIVTDSSLVEIARCAWVFYAHDGMFRLPDDQRALDMHRKSGLLAECKRSPYHPEDLQDEIVQWITDAGAAGSPMHGAGIQFDRRWLACHMPRLHDLFHYRNGDATHYRILADRLGVTCPPKREAHRALTDLEDSIALMQWGDARFIAGHGVLP